MLPDWECTEAPSIVAIYKKAKPTLPRVSALVRHLVEQLRPYDIAR